MKKILIIALVAGFISTASAKNNTPNLLVKPNVNSSSLLVKSTTKSFNPACVQTCRNNLNACLANASSPMQIDHCQVSWEVCTVKCDFEGPGWN